MENKQHGKIIIIIGPMFSGKSTKLIEYINRYVYKKKKVIMLKFQLDTRYSENDVLVTHDKREYPALPVSELGPMIDTIRDYEVIGIDEGQFYCDIVEYAHKLALDGKIIIISGLSGTFKMEPFENMSKLISIADEVVFCRSVCVSCTDDASFTLRTSNSEELVSIGGADTYKPVCRRCFVKENKFY